MEILQYLLMAFAGGVILNVMPCVLPVLTLKLFHTLETFGHGRSAEHRAHGLAYAVGTTTAFVGFATIVVLLRASGEVLGWGMHFQHPPFVAALTTLIFAAGLNALGVFEISVSSSSGAREGLLGAFANGVFAAVMSTPCTAPFLSSAAGFALAADTAAWQTLVLFAAIGFGLAFPYTLVGFMPGLAKILPKPGAWMETFKSLMGFTLLAAAVWLFGALQTQVSADSALWFLAFLLALAMALWGMERFATMRHSAMRRVVVRVALLGSVAGAGALMLRFDPPVRAAVQLAAAVFDDRPVASAEAIHWRPFDPSALSRENGRRRPVFVDYTADWCAACKANEKLVLDTAPVRQALIDSGILPMKADMTNEDEVLEKWLGRLEVDGRKVSGIPAYVLYLPDQTVEVLPTVITTGLIVERFQKVANRFPRLAVSN